MKLVFLILLLAGTAAAGAPAVGLHGSLQTGLSVLHGIGDGSLAGTGSSLLTLNAGTRRAERARVEAELDVAQYYGAAAEAAAAPDSSVLAGREGAAPVAVSLRKLYLSLYTRYADIAIGRQLINFGKGYVFSPIDVYSTVDVTDLSFRRTGSDAARGCIPFGALSGIDLVTSLTRAADAPAAVKAFTNIGGWDLALTGIYKQRSYETYAGLSFKGDMVLGVCGELVQHFVNDAGRHDFRGMLGLDYSIGSAWLFMGEYYYRETETPSAAEPLYGRHNLFGSIRYAFNELMNVSVNTLADPDSGMSLTTLQYFYNIFQNTDCILYLRHYGTNGTPLAAVLPYDLEYGTRISVKF